MLLTYPKRYMEGIFGLIPPRIPTMRGPHQLNGIDTVTPTCPPCVPVPCVGSASQGGPKCCSLIQRATQRASFSTRPPPTLMSARRTRRWASTTSGAQDCCAGTRGHRRGEALPWSVFLAIFSVFEAARYSGIQQIQQILDTARYERIQLDTVGSGHRQRLVHEAAARGRGAVSPPLKCVFGHIPGSGFALTLL